MNLVAEKETKQLSGFIIVDKPSGYTSHDVVEEIRRFLHPLKVGHLGTLDPLATGVLPVAVGKATKLTNLLLVQDKRYLADIIFGKETDSGDITGEVILSSEKRVSESDFLKCLEEFTGEYEQIPPDLSAIKINGKRAYELHRQGLKVQFKPRKVKIYEIKSLGFNGDKANLSIHCSKGTYIRALVRDIGRKLGCYATLLNLRRTETGPFRIENAHKLRDVIECLQKGEVKEIMEEIIPEKLGFKRIILNRNLSYRVSHGISPRLNQTDYFAKLTTGEIVFMTDEEGDVIAVAQYLPSKKGDFKFLRVLK